MRILVSVKRVADYEAQLKIDDTKKFIDMDSVNMITNPFDEIGVEEAIRIKKHADGEIVCISIGEKDAMQNIRTALAMGADRGILVESANKDYFINTEYVSCIFKRIIDEEKPDLIIMGKQSIDTDNHQTCEYLSSLLGMGSASQANKITIDKTNNRIIVKKEVDGGLETVSLPTPCFVSTDLRLNEPRYASLPGIMKAKRKIVKIVNIESLNIAIKKNITISNLHTQPKKQNVVFLKNVKELMIKLNKIIKSL